MPIFAQESDALEDVLSIMEHPQASFKSLAWYTQIPLAVFLIIWLPLGFIIGILIELCWRIPYKLLYGRRKWRNSTDDVAFWEDFVAAEPRRKFFMLLLQDEIVVCPAHDSETTPSEKSNISRRTSWSSRLTESWSCARLLFHDQQVATPSKSLHSDGAWDFTVHVGILPSPRDSTESA